MAGRRAERRVRIVSGERYGLRMAGHVFVDESKRRDYVLAAAAVPIDTLQTARTVIRALRLPGQTKIHMVKESSGRQRSLLAAIGSLDVRVSMYVAAKTTFTAHVDARRRCLESLIDDIAVYGHSSVCIERDDSQEGIGSAKPERHNRPEGSRAHFLRLLPQALQL